MSSVFAGEEIAELHKTLRRLEKVERTLTTDRDRLADLLRDEKDAHQQTGRALDEANAQLHSTRIEMDRFRAIAQTVDQANDARGKADRERNALAGVMARLGAKHAKAVAALDKANRDRDDLRARNDSLEAEIGPFRGLIAAWQAQKAAEEQISSELGRLGK